MWLRHLYDIPFGVAQGMLDYVHCPEIVLMKWSSFLESGLLLQGPVPHLWHGKSSQVFFALGTQV
jgi:hypothetical protein